MLEQNYWQLELLSKMLIFNTLRAVACRLNSVSLLIVDTLSTLYQGLDGGQNQRRVSVVGSEYDLI